MNIKRRNDFWKELDKPTNDIDLSKFKDDIPKHIYRYRSVSENSLAALLNDRLYFSTSNYYDDPFDTLFCIDKTKLAKEIFEILKDKNNEALFKQIQMYFNFKNFITIDEVIKNKEFLFEQLYLLIDNIRDVIKKEIYSVCFSESALNQDLWLKYADNYSGFTIEYETKTLLESNLIIYDKNNQLINKPIAYLYPMVYSNKPFYANELFKNIIYRIAKFDYLIKDIKRFLIDRRRVCLIKNSFHSNDKEWRLFVDGIPSYINLKPKAVILGLKISTSSREIIINICKNKNIDVYETFISNDYKLKKRKIIFN